jgi:hypothetical protein
MWFTWKWCEIFQDEGTPAAIYRLHKYIIAAILLELRLHYLNCGWISLQFGISVQQNFKVLTLDSISSSLRCHDDDYWRNGLFRFGDNLSLYYGIHGVAPLHCVDSFGNSGSTVRMVVHVFLSTAFSHWLV